MRLPWSFSLIRKYHRCMPLRSIMRYRAALLRERQGKLAFADTLELDLKWPVRGKIALRPASNDCFTLDEIFVHRVYDALLGHARGARTVLDLGANIGLATLYLAGHLPHARFLCVEPDPRNFELLQFNVRTLAAAGLCLTWRGAVWGSNTPVVLNHSSSEGHVNQRSVRAAGEDAGATEALEGRTIEGLMDQSGFGRVDLLKIDVEGAEEGIFSGPCDWLTRVRTLGVEFHDGSRERSDFDRNMANHGFKLYEADPHTVVAVKA